MATSLSDGFVLPSGKYNFTRDAVATIAEFANPMLAFKYPDMYEVFCLEDGCKYRIDKIRNEKLPDLGYWRKVEGGSGSGGSSPLPENVTEACAEMPEASEEYSNKIIQYVGPTTGSVVEGYFYKCKETPGTLVDVPLYQVIGSFEYEIGDPAETKSLTLVTKSATPVVNDEVYMLSVSAENVASITSIAKVIKVNEAVEESGAVTYDIESTMEITEDSSEEDTLINGAITKSGVTISELEYSYAEGVVHVQEPGPSTYEWKAIPVGAGSGSGEGGSGGEGGSPSVPAEGCTYSIGADEQLNININNISRITKSQAQGGITFADFMNMLNYAASSVSLSTSAKKVYETKVDSISSITFSISKTNKSFPITELYLYQGSTKISENIVDETTFTYTPETPISNSTSFVLKGVTSEPKDVSSSSISLSFYAPFYYGVSDKATLEEADIKALTKLIEGKGNKTFKFTGSAVYSVIAYPKSYGKFTSILDPNGFENLSAFKEPVVVTVNEIEYYVYIYSTVSTYDNTAFSCKF